MSSFVKNTDNIIYNPSAKLQKGINKEGYEVKGIVLKNTINH